jgi:hypothetical protein
MSFAMITQRLSSASLHPLGSSNFSAGLATDSAFRYMVADGDARVLSHLSCFSCTWLPLPPSEHPISFTFFMLFSKPYVVDSSFFPSHASVSPGLTVIANALRVGDRLIEQLK